MMMVDEPEKLEKLLRFLEERRQKIIRTIRLELSLLNSYSPVPEGKKDVLGDCPRQKDFLELNS